jgi:hypothetical protein
MGALLISEPLGCDSKTLASFEAVPIKSKERIRECQNPMSQICLCSLSQEASLFSFERPVLAASRGGLGLLVDIQLCSLTGLRFVFHGDELFSGLLLCLSGVSLCWGILSSSHWHHASESDGEGYVW